MWQTFWGTDLDRLSPSNRRAVVPGGWRMEVSPSAPARDDVFLNVLEIGDRGAASAPRIEAIGGNAIEGTAVEDESVVLFAAGEAEGGAEATLPAVRTRSLLVAGLEPRAAYEIQFTSGFAPGAPVWRATAEASDESTIFLSWENAQDGRLRLRRLR